MKGVFDTNVLVAALNFDGICRHLLRRAVRRHDIFTSDRLLGELRRNLVAKFGWAPGKAEEAARLFEDRFWRIEPSPLRRRICRDPDDDHVIAGALAAGADAVVTGDRDLLLLKSHGGVSFVSPRDFFDLLGENSRMG